MYNIFELLYEGEGTVGMTFELAYSSAAALAAGYATLASIFAF